MALKFRRVKRRKRNPSAAKTSLLVSGGLIVGAILVIRHMMNKVPAAAKFAAPRVPKELVEQIDMERGDVTQLEGVGGIFAGGW